MSFAQIIRFARHARQFEKVPRKSPEYVESLRRERLRRLLQHAVTASFFREKYRGLDLDQIELSQLPPTNKQELMTSFDHAITDPAIRRTDVEKFMMDPASLGRLFRGRYCVSHTSGSQGQPLLRVQDPRCLAILFRI